MTYYVVWIFLLALYNVVYGVLSYYSNHTQSNFYFWALYGMSILTIWPFITKFSNNLVFDGILYDCIVVIMFASTLLFLEGACKFTWLQLAALFLMILGTILFKVGEWR
jgi:hypothetical protein